MATAGRLRDGRRAFHSSLRSGSEERTPIHFLRCFFWFLHRSAITSFKWTTIKACPRGYTATSGPKETELHRQHG